LRSSQFLPRWLRSTPQFIQRLYRRRYWWSLRTKPVSGWLVQQLLKIGAASVLPEERCCIVDSDNVFFRKFDLSALKRPNPLPLFNASGEVPADSPMHTRWVESSHRLLGLGKPAFPATDFIGNVIIWDQIAVRAMTKRVESVTGMGWAEALCRAHDISEYMLYGYFVQNSIQHLAEHILTSRKLCVSYWGEQALDEHTIDNMLSSADANCVAFSATSFSGTPVDLIRSSLRKHSTSVKADRMTGS
jgi:Family of unknown function (DUF6492)